MSDVLPEDCQSQVFLPFPCAMRDGIAVANGSISDTEHRYRIFRRKQFLHVLPILASRNAGEIEKPLNSCLLPCPCLIPKWPQLCIVLVLDRWALA